MLKLVVLSCLMAVASAAVLAPFSPFVYGAPFVTPYAYNFNNNYRGPLSLAPGQPANILAADGRPLDTLDVNLDRSAHFVSKALTGAHVLKKRSVAVAPVVAPAFGAHLAVAHAAPLVSPVAPWGYTRFAPYTHFTSPLTTYW